MDVLNQQYGKPHQLALQRTAELMDGPNVDSGEVKAFCMFASGDVALQCGSHVSTLKKVNFVSC